MKHLPVIDLFAGPGGLGEGFSEFRDNPQIRFDIHLSIEMDEIAHRTLMLRSFTRKFRGRHLPEAYYQYLEGLITRERLIDMYPEEAAHANAEAFRAELGAREPGDNEIDRRIREARGSCDQWILIGGPPCQAYSLVGRSRIRGQSEKKYRDDARHELYKQYLRVLATHQPPVFVMENVKGIISTRLGKENIFERILRDLQSPCTTTSLPGRPSGSKTCSYRLRSLTQGGGDLFSQLEPADFVVKAENYGIPQSRHRVFIVGIRSDIAGEPGLLEESGKKVHIEDVISDLPRLRSGLSEEDDRPGSWARVIEAAEKANWLKSERIPEKVEAEIRRTIDKISHRLPRGKDNPGPDARRDRCPRFRPDWFIDENVRKIFNHSSRSHISADLHRYLFASCFARIMGRSPLLREFPRELLPAHKNVKEAIASSKFGDRFRVQAKGRPATTITSHASKDGHYFIHYDPSQCRSLTVREVARIQTFPDSYFFEGNRTQQYVQVGNAVPPLLAIQIAGCVAKIFEE